MVKPNWAIIMYIMLLPMSPNLFQKVKISIKLNNNQ